MDVEKINWRKIKTVYVIIAGLLALGAIVSAFLHISQYVTFAFILAASAVILIGSFFVSYLYHHQKMEDVD